MEVQEYFQTFLHRTGKASGRAVFVNMFQAGASETDVQAAIISSPEYTANHPTADSFVTGLFNDVLGRQPRPQGLAVWEQRLSGMSRLQLAKAFLTSTEADRHYVDELFLEYLNRSPSLAEEQSEVFALTHGVSIETVTEMLFASKEYYQQAH